MDDAERAWLREKLYEHAAELGAQKASERAQDKALGDIRQEVRELGLSIKTEIASHYNHVRGEIAQLKDEERRRTEALIRELDERDDARDERARRTWRFLLLIGGAIVVGGQQLFDHLPALLSLLAP